MSQCLMPLSCRFWKTLRRSPVPDWKSIKTRGMTSRQLSAVSAASILRRVKRECVWSSRPPIISASINRLIPTGWIFLLSSVFRMMQNKKQQGCTDQSKSVIPVFVYIHLCFFPFISQTYSPLFYHFPVRFFLLYRKQACSAPFHVFLLFLKQAECVFLLFPKQASFMSVSFFLLYPKQAYWGMVRIFLLFPKHLVVWGEKKSCGGWPQDCGSALIRLLG